LIDIINKLKPTAMKKIVLTLMTITLDFSVPPRSFAIYSQGNEILISDSSKLKEIDIRKISISRLKLDVNTKEIMKILGQPRQRQRKQGNTSRCGEKGITLKYNKLDITLGCYPNPSSIFTISTANPAYATGKSVYVGDPISKAKKAYSKYRSTTQGQYLIYPVSLGESSLTFKINKGLITEMILDERC
jgi:hypothetical protein